MVINSKTELKNVDAENFVVDDGALFSHHGIIDGNVDVRNGSFVLYGIMEGRLSVSQCGTAEIRGTARLSEVVALGPIDVYGIVKAPSDGGLIPREGCIINGVKH